jgi:hypothetical protein
MKKWILNNLGFFIVIIGIILVFGFWILFHGEDDNAIDIVTISIASLCGLCGIILQVNINKEIEAGRREHEVELNNEKIKANNDIEAKGRLQEIEINNRNIKENNKIESERREHEIELNHKRTLAQIRLENYDSRKETYYNFLKPFMEIFMAQRKASKKKGKKGGKAIPDNLIDHMLVANIDLHLLGSDETCGIWREWRKISFKTPSEDPEVQKMRNTAGVVFYARIILSIRKDLGQEDTSINEMDILRSFITDIDNIMDDLNHVMKWKTADEIP